MSNYHIRVITQCKDPFGEHYVNENCSVLVVVRGRFAVVVTLETVLDVRTVDKLFSTQPIVNFIE